MPNLNSTASEKGCKIQFLKRIHIDLKWEEELDEKGNPSERK